VAILTIVVTGSCWRVVAECLVEMNLEEFGEDADDDDKHENKHHGKDDGDNNSDSSGFQHEKLELQKLWHIISSLPIEVGFGLFTVLCAWSLTSLTCFHAMIITIAQTTNERVRGVYEYGGLGNPADEGCWRNWKGAMCDDIVESRLPKDFSEVVSLEKSSLVDGSDGTDGERGGVSSPMVEESVWPGWHHSHSFTSLMSAAPKSGATES